MPTQLRCQYDSQTDRQIDGQMAFQLYIRSRLLYYNIDFKHLYAHSFTMSHQQLGDYNFQILCIWDLYTTSTCTYHIMQVPYAYLNCWLYLLSLSYYAYLKYVQLITYA